MTSPEKLATPEINHASAETAKVLEHAIGALADILGGWRYIRQSHGDLYGVGWDRCEKSASIAIAALRTEVEALATQRQGEGDGWKPIESAPKDGTEIILSNGKDVSAGSWFSGSDGTCDSDGAPNCDERDAGWLDWSGGMLPEPTHFMPIPAAPGATSQGVAVAQPDAPPAIKNKGVAFRDWETHPLYKSATAMGHFDAGWMRCLAATTSKD